MFCVINSAFTCRAGQLPARPVDVGRVCCNLPDVAGLDADEHVLRFDVRVDDLALRVQVVQSFQNLKNVQNLLINMLT